MASLFSGQRARQPQAGRFLTRFDMIFAMDASNESSTMRRGAVLVGMTDFSVSRAYAWQPG